MLLIWPVSIAEVNVRQHTEHEWLALPALTLFDCCL